MWNQWTPPAQPSFFDCPPLPEGRARPRVLCVARPGGDTWCQLVRESLADVAPVDVAAPLSAAVDVAVNRYDVVVLDAAQVDDLIDLVSEVRRHDDRAAILVASAAPTWQQVRDVFRAGATRYCQQSPHRADIRAEVGAALPAPRR